MAAITREVAWHFRDQLRDARAAVLRDAEAFRELIVVLERLGVFLCDKMVGLDKGSSKISELASRSAMANEIPAAFPESHQRFEVKYKLVQYARNAAVHEGALARHLSTNAIELSLVLEEAIMSEYTEVKDFMVRNVICAYLWQPLSFIRQTMLVNSFSYLPVPVERDAHVEWHLISDFVLAQYVRKNPENSRNALGETLVDALAASHVELIKAESCGANLTIGKLLTRSSGRPTLVLSTETKELLGIVTPFDLL